jgi:hypothetical protein
MRWRDDHRDGDKPTIGLVGGGRRLDNGRGGLHRHAVAMSLSLKLISTL